MFNWSENITLPKLSDLINGSVTPPNVARVFTYPWVTFLGGWFFAIVIGIIGGALHMKQKNTMVTVVYFIIMTSIFNSVLFIDPDGLIPSAASFVYFVGILAAFVIGYLLYQLFVSKRE